MNGSSDDWMYAEGGTKSFTPEVGATGFWPQPNEIEGLNRENMWQNLSMALCALRFGEVKKTNDELKAALGVTQKGVTRTTLLAMHAFEAALKHSGLSKADIANYDTALIGADLDMKMGR